MDFNRAFASRMSALPQAILKRMNVDIDPHEKVFQLSMWQCQVVEIAKAMSCDPKVLMLDEPTSALAQNETQSLFEVIRTLRDQGVVIIYISHRLQEIWEIADTVTVLRDGQLIGKEQVSNKVADHGVINGKRRTAFATRQVEDLQIKIPSIMATARSLSVGSQVALCAVLFNSYLTRKKS